jgi:nucleotide-binding universal stress UspA family protein
MAAKPIVVGTDGSEPSQRAVDWAAKEATRRQVPLRIVSVIPQSGWFAPPDNTIATRRAAAVKALDDAAESVSMTAPDLTVDTSLPSGEPGPVLAAIGTHACLLVVGSAGTTLAPVSRYLAIHAPCPVVVIGSTTPARPAQLVNAIKDPVGARQGTDPRGYVSSANGRSTSQHACPSR